MMSSEKVIDNLSLHWQMLPHAHNHVICNLLATTTIYLPLGNNNYLQLITASCGHMIMVCDLSSLFPTKKVSWGSFICLMTAEKMFVKLHLVIMMDHFTTGLTYDGNSSSNY